MGLFSKIGKAVSGVFSGGGSSALGALSPTTLIATAGLGFGDSLLQGYQNRKAAQQANKYAYTAWQLQNQYNTPKEQRERLEDAGYNPNLWYTQGNTGNAGTLVTTGPQAANWNVAEKAMRGLAQYQQMEATQANIRNTNANTDLAKYNAYNVDLQGRVLQHNLRYAQKHDLPVGQLETYPSRVLGEFSDPKDGVVLKTARSLYRSGKALGEKFGDVFIPIANSVHNWKKRNRYWLGY